MKQEPGDAPAREAKPAQESVRESAKKAPTQAPSREPWSLGFRV